MGGVVVDVQILMIGSGLSDPCDDGSCLAVMTAMHDSEHMQLVIDDESLIRTQYERKLREDCFGRVWFDEMLNRNKVLFVKRVALVKKVSQAIRGTGLVGEDLKYYVRTAAASAEKALISQDGHYEEKTCKVLKKHLKVMVLSAEEGGKLALTGG